MKSLPSLSSVSILITILSLAPILCSAQDNHNIADLLGPYMGQEPPGMKPQVFAIGIIASDLHGCPVFTPDGSEVYWKPISFDHVMYSRMTDGYWSIPGEFEFPDEFINSNVPCLSTDGNRLFFVSKEPIGPGAEAKESIWIMERGKDGWMSPKPLSKAVNEMELHWQVSVARNGNLYFHSLSTGGGDIYLSRFADGKYTKPAIMEPSINGSTYDHAPFIAPDESYLILSRIDFASDNRYANLYISFRNPDGTWTEAQPMEELNEENVHEIAANVTRDGEYLFFLRNTNGGLSAHWVSSRVIDNYRP